MGLILGVCRAVYSFRVGINKQAGLGFTTLSTVSFGKGLSGWLIAVIIVM
jgi:hypothetical protein